MKFLLPILFVFAFLQIGSKAFAQSTSVYAPSAHSLQRYNVTLTPVYRHCEDVRRYNAAPNKFGYRGNLRKTHPITSATFSACSLRKSCETPTKVSTETVCTQNKQVAYYDKHGCRQCRTMTVTVYKDIYSNGGCRIWHHIGY